MSGQTLFERIRAMADNPPEPTPHEADHMRRLLITGIESERVAGELTDDCAAELVKAINEASPRILDLIVIDFGGARVSERVASVLPLGNGAGAL